MTALARPVAAAVCALALAATPARADDRPADYDTRSGAWNGLTTFLAVARGLGLEVLATPRLDWDDLGYGDAIIVVYPTAQLDPGQLVAFVRGGGRVAVADDFGAGGEIMTRLGLLRRDARVEGARFHRELPFAPLAAPRDPDHPLARGVDAIATNHPAAFAHASGPEPVMTLPSGDAVVAAGALGSGRIVALSDPSVLINRMLEFEGNLQFAINLLRYLRRDGLTRRVVVMTGDVRLFGRPPPPPAGGALSDSVAVGLEHINRAADGFNDYLFTEPGLRVVAVALALGVGLLGLAALPRPPRTRLDGRWTRATDRSPPLEHFEDLVAHYDGGPAADGYALPAAVLRDALDLRLGRRLGVNAPLASLPEPELYRRIDAVCGREAAVQLRRLYPALAPIPSRVRAAAPWESTPVSRREFERLHSAVADLYRTLGET